MGQKMKREQQMIYEVKIRLAWFRKVEELGICKRGP